MSILQLKLADKHSSQHKQQVVERAMLANAEVFINLDRLAQNSYPDGTGSARRGKPYVR